MNIDEVFNPNGTIDQYYQDTYHYQSPQYELQILQSEIESLTEKVTSLRNETENLRDEINDKDDIIEHYHSLATGFIISTFVFFIISIFLIWKMKRIILRKIKWK